MKNIKVTENEKEIKGLQSEVKKMSNIMDHLRSQNRVLTTNIKKIFKIWDGFFKTMGVVFSIGVVSMLMYCTRDLYYLNGKWDFAVVFVGGILFLGLLGALIAGVWYIVNEALINKFEMCNRR